MAILVFAPIGSLTVCMHACMNDKLFGAGRKSNANPKGSCDEIMIKTIEEKKLK